MSQIPAVTASDAERPAAAAARDSVAAIWVGAGRLVRAWPGMVVIPAAYGVLVAVLSSLEYAYLIAAVGAAAIGVAWYASPLGRLEARRRLTARDAP